MNRTFESLDRDPWAEYRYERIPPCVAARAREEVRAFERTAEFATLRRQLDLRGPRLVAWRDLANRSTARRLMAMGPPPPLGPPPRLAPSGSATGLFRTNFND